MAATSDGDGKGVSGQNRGWPERVPIPAFNFKSQFQERGSLPAKCIEYYEHK